MLRRTLTLCLAVLLAGSATAQLRPGGGPPPQGGPPPKAEPVPEPPKPLDRPMTEAIVRSYATAEHWALQAIVLLSLGNDFHPAGAAPVIAALNAEDERLRPYAIELLHGMETSKLASVATPEVVDAVVEFVSKEKNELLATRTLEVLARLFPSGPGAERKAWKRYWQEARATYVPTAWEPPPGAEPEGRSSAGAFVERAFDLRDAGLDVAIVIDSTGSMQVAIDTARDAINDVVSLLAGVAPKLRLGLVHYKDVSDFSDGAKLVVSMTKKHDAVREGLAKLIAGGGGDVPESVDEGFEVALTKEMDWNKDANRLILIIGDAPPQPRTMEGLLKAVKEAHDRPFLKGSKAVTGKREQLRPFITSTICTSAAARETFEQISKAGGGTNVMMEVRGGGGGVRGPQGGGDPEKAARGIVEHILLLSFGVQYRPQLERFVHIYFEYRDAGLFK
jgi:Mg-chelatase subunit ChlD